ncbi:MAG: Type restriction enzyme protein [Verrucomicrobiota bacterium]|jgi:type I restriction enzyme R subunit
MFGTAFSTEDTQSLYRSYQHIAKKVKGRQVDPLLVVNMRLTGFDGKTLNTGWVDKNLKHQGPIEAF